MKLSFSLRWLFVALLVVGIALTAALNANSWWNEATRTVLIVSVFLATIIGWLRQRPALLCFALSVVLCVLFDIASNVWYAYEAGTLLNAALSNTALLLYEEGTREHFDLVVQLNYQRVFVLGIAGGCIGWRLAKRKQMRDEGSAK